LNGFEGELAVSAYRENHYRSGVIPYAAICTQVCRGSFIVKKHRPIVPTILRRYPDTQAVYLFGSWGTGDEWAHSDVDIAVLLPVRTAKKRRLRTMDRTGKRSPPSTKRITFISRVLGLSRDNLCSINQ